MVYKSVQMKPKEYLPCSEWSEFGGNKSFISSHKSNFSLRLLSCRQLDPLVLHNNSKSVAFHTTVPMWSFNWSWYFNERSISVLRAKLIMNENTFHCLAYFCNSLGTIATFMWIREETLFTMTMSQFPSSFNRNFVWKCQNDLPKYLNDFIYFS